MRRQLVAAACLVLLTAATARADPDTDAVIKFELLGDWAPDCSRPPAASNVYVRFAIVNSKPTRTLLVNGAYPVMAMRSVRITAPDRLVYLLELPTGGMQIMVIARVGKAIRSHETIGVDGKAVIKDGRFVASGAPTLLYQRCSAQITTIADRTVRA